MTNTLNDLAQGNLALLDDDAAQQLLHSTEMAHLAYDWNDGTPRCTAIWFHWNGEALVMASPTKAPKVRAIASGSPVAVTIDSTTFPYTSLNLRGAVEVDRTSGVAPEYRLAAIRYLGQAEGEAWCDNHPDDIEMARFTLRPDWVGVIDIGDFRRIPSALAG